jgi:hypothetical protein
MKVAKTSPRSTVNCRLYDIQRPRSYFGPFYLKVPTYRPEHQWVVEQNSHLLAHLRVFDRVVLIGDAVLRVAAIGNVITAPEQRWHGTPSATSPTRTMFSVATYQYST